MLNLCLLSNTNIHQKPQQQAVVGFFYGIRYRRLIGIRSVPEVLASCHTFCQGSYSWVNPIYMSERSDNQGRFISKMPRHQIIERKNYESIQYDKSKIYDHKEDMIMSQKDFLLQLSALFSAYAESIDKETTKSDQSNKEPIVIFSTRDCLESVDGLTYSHLLDLIHKKLIIAEQNVKNGKYRINKASFLNYFNKMGKK